MKAPLSYIFCDLEYHCIFRVPFHTYSIERKHQQMMFKSTMNRFAAFWGTALSYWGKVMIRMPGKMQLLSGVKARSMRCQTLFGNRIWSTTQLFYVSAAKTYHLSPQDFMEPSKIFCAIFSRQQKRCLNMKINPTCKLNKIKRRFGSSFGLCSEAPDVLDLIQKIPTS